MGVLRDGLLRRRYSLTEARILYELGRRDDDRGRRPARELLNIDAGYLSRRSPASSAAGSSRASARRPTGAAASCG